MANVEGPVSTLVLDSAKLLCPVCNTTQCQLTGTMVDPNSISDATNITFAALDITYATGTSAQGLVALCRNGHEWTPFWYVCDIAASNGTTLRMTNLDAGTANLLAGGVVYMIYLGSDANDAGKYFTITSHTAAAPTVITPDGTVNAGTDGFFMITNILPVGFTLAT